MKQDINPFPDIVHFAGLVLVLVAAVGFAVAGIVRGEPALVVALPVAWVYVAVDPKFGKWNHVWPGVSK